MSLRCMTMPAAFPRAGGGSVAAAVAGLWRRTCPSVKASPIVHQSWQHAHTHGAWAARGITSYARRQAHPATAGSVATGVPAALAASPCPPAPSTSVYAGVSGQCALITGGSSGIGLAIARLLCEQGMRVAITSRSQQRAQKAADDIARAVASSSHSGTTSVESSHSVLALEADVRSSASVDAAVERAWAAFGERLDLVVHAAGVSHDALLLRASDDHISDTLQTNLSGALYVSRAAARKMIMRRSQTSSRSARSVDTSSSPSADGTASTGTAAPPAASPTRPGGSIVFIGSVVGQQGAVGQSVYAASKAGLHGVTSSLSAELASRSIRVNCVCPGFISTPMTARLSPSAQASIVHRIPAGRMGQPEEVAHLVAFLASDHAKYIQGQMIAVDGGIR